MRNRAEILETIKELEKQLNELKLELTTESTSETSPIEVGDRVVILNPRPGQGSKGVVSKIHWKSGRVTVEAKGTAGLKQKIVRALHNIRKEE